MMGYKRFLLIFMAMLMLTGSAHCAAEDMRFVDSRGMTGYYVDMDSIYCGEESLLNVRIAVVKADQNRKYSYMMQFNTKERTYQILSSQVLEYNTKRVLESGGTQSTAQPYGTASVMHEMIEYIRHPDPR